MDKVYCNVKVVTFGSPRIGNREFTKYIDQYVPINIRVINDTDIVPHLPSRVFFKHTGYAIHMEPK
jgi:predicted lipase